MQKFYEKVVLLFFLLFNTDRLFIQNNKATFVKRLFCFILSNVFFYVWTNRKSTKEKHKSTCYVARQWCVETYLFLASRHVNNVIHAFFISNTFISNTFISNARLKLAKNQATAKQHPEVEPLLVENYSFFIHVIIRK